MARFLSVSEITKQKEHATGEGQSQREECESDQGGPFFQDYREH